MRFRFVCLLALGLVLQAFAQSRQLRVELVDPQAKAVCGAQLEFCYSLEQPDPSPHGAHSETQRGLLSDEQGVCTLELPDYLQLLDSPDGQARHQASVGVVCSGFAPQVVSLTGLDPVRVQLERAPSLVCTVLDVEGRAVSKGVRVRLEQRACNEAHAARRDPSWRGVRLTAARRLMTDYTVKPASEGTFAFPSVITPTCCLLVEKDGFPLHYVHAIDPRKRAAVTLQLERGGQELATQVVDELGAPLAEVAVECSLISTKEGWTPSDPPSLHTQGRAVSAADGRVRFQALAPGRYRLSVWVGFRGEVEVSTDVPADRLVVRQR